MSAAVWGSSIFPWGGVVILLVEMVSWQHAMGDAFNGLIFGGAGRRVSQMWQRQGRGASSDSSGRGGSSDSLSGAEPSSGSGRDTDASLCSSSSVRLRRRNAFVLAEQQELGDEASRFREAFFEEHGNTQGWLSAFMRERLHFDNIKSCAARAAYAQVKCAVRTAKGGIEKVKQQQGKKSMTCTAGVTSQSRKRRKGGGARPKCAVLWEELWAWYVDRLQTCPGRIGTQLLVDHASVISSDILDEWRMRSADGHADFSAEPELPAITNCWVQRWRRAYGVTFRAVNLRYKISHSKRMLRLRVYWSNVLRVRLLHECLFGRDGVDFVCMDQKPLYFNSSIACKTLAPRGTKKVNVKESMADSRERFTLMSTCPSWTVSRAPGLAVLFRHAGAEDSRVTRTVRTYGAGLVQWAPKGSYRLQHVLDYLRWAVIDKHAIPEQPQAVTDPDASPDRIGAARAPAKERHLVVVLDWFAPHLDERVDDLLRGAGAGCLRIGGGLTGDVQVPDTHRHGPLTSSYRTLEARDSRAQLRLRPSKLPSFSRQAVFNRSKQAWAQTSAGADGRKEWIQNACLNALDGSEDGMIQRDLLGLWMHIGMPNIREQLREEIKSEVQAGRLHSFWQYTELLESYDDHPGLIEGMEDAEEYVHDDDAGDDDEGGGNDDDGAPDASKLERRDLEELPDASRGDTDASHGGGDSTPDTTSVPEAGASSPAEHVVSTLPKDLQDKAEAELRKSQRANQVKALSDAALILRQSGDTTHAQVLDDRVHAILRAERTVCNSTRLFLTARSLQRAEAEAREREEAEREDARKQELDTLYRLAKEETAAKRAAAVEAREENRKKVLEAYTERKALKDEAERRKANLLYAQQHLAADLVRRAYDFLQHRKLGAARVAALRLRMKRVVGARECDAATGAILDPAWAGHARDGCVVITPAIDCVKTKGKAKKEWASERTARAVFGGRDPKEAKSAEAIWSRLGKLINEIAPGYDYKLFKGCHLANDLLDRYNRNVDLCIVSALQRYCLVTTEEEYPCIVRDWPWHHERMDQWVANHRDDAERASARAEARNAAVEPVGPRSCFSSSGPASSCSSHSGPSSAGCASSRPRGDLGKALERPGKRSRRELGECVGPPSSPAPEHAPGSLYSKWAEAP